MLIGTDFRHTFGALAAPHPGCRGAEPSAPDIVRSGGMVHEKRCARHLFSTGRYRCGGFGAPVAGGFVVPAGGLAAGAGAAVVPAGGAAGVVVGAVLVAAGAAA